MANKNSRTKNFALSLLTGIAGQLIYEALRFITRTVFIYTLGKMFLGINGLFSDIMTMLSLTNLGFGTAIIYRLYKPLAENDERQVRILMKFYKVAYQSIGAIILVLGLCLLPFLDVIIKDYEKLGNIGLNAELVYLLFLGQSVCTYFFFAYRNSIFSADQKRYIVSSVHILSNILCCIAQIVVLYVWTDFILYLIVGILSGILSNLILAVLAYRQYPNFFKKEKESLPASEVKLMFKDCGALFIYKVNGVVQKSTGNLILSSFVGLATVALYSNYLMVYVALRHLSNQLFNAAKGSMGNLFAKESIEKKYFYFELMNYLTIIIFGTLGVTVALTVNELIYAWIGKDYIIAQPFPILMGVELLVMGLALNLNQIRNVTGLFRQMWFRPVVSMAVNLVSTLVLVLFIGVLAIPLGYIIAVSATNLVADPTVIHRNGFNNFRTSGYYYRKNAMYLIVTLIAGTVCFGFCRMVVPSNVWFTFLLHAAFCALIVPGTLIIVYRNTDVGVYLISKVKSIIKKRRL